MNARTQSREYAIQMCFAHEFSASKDFPAVSAYFEHFGWEEKCQPYTKALIDALTANHTAVDEAIERHSHNWKFNRIPKVELSILRVMIAEVLFLKTIPPKVGISEGVGLGLALASDESKRFLNGLLDAVFKEHFGGEFA